MPTSVSIKREKMPEELSSFFGGGLFAIEGRFSKRSIITRAKIKRQPRAGTLSLR
jgi:hypothetical protein